MNVFAQVGVANAGNPVRRYLGGGVTMSAPFGLWRGGGDEIGYGIAVPRLAADTAGPSRSEIAHELSYAVMPADWLRIQGAFQYIRHPATARAAADARVLQLRATLTW